MSEIRDKIVRYLQDEVLLSQDPLEDRLQLLSVLDSLSLLQLVGFLEEEFEVEIPDEAVTGANFGTTQAVVALVQSRLASRGLLQ
jgi:acyl carrier protein